MKQTLGVKTFSVEPTGLTGGESAAQKPLNNYQKIGVLIGKTLREVRQIETDEIRFIDGEGGEYRMFHDQDCCESVQIDDVCGDLQDLVGSPILQAEENSNANENPEGVKNPESNPDSFTWTFYRLATAKGSVVIRWYGSSNGYYSESVDFCKIN